MSHFTPLSALAGGALIGLGCALLLLLHGKTAGISGICGGLLRVEKGDIAWRAWFIAGMALTAVVADGSRRPPLRSRCRAVPRS